MTEPTMTEPTMTEGTMTEETMTEAAPVTAPIAAARSRLGFLDSVRAVAAVYVVLHHIWLTAYPGYPNNASPWFFDWLAYGQLAVAIFIVVSGFSLTIAPARHDFVLRGGARTFLRRRAWRILPTYWAALAFSCLVYGVVTAAQTGSAITGKAVLVHGLLLQDVINSPKPNGAFWSIAIEWQIYFLFPLFLLIRRTWGPRTLVAVAVPAVVAAYLLATHVSQFDPILNLSPQFVALFVLGMVAAEQVNQGVHSQSSRWSLIAASGLGFLAVCSVAGRGMAWVEAHYFWIDLLVGAAAALLLAALAGGRGNALRALLESRALSFTGRFSYSIYCIHLPLLWLTWHFVVTRIELGPVAQLLVLTLIGVPVVLAGSWLFSLAFEQPFVRNRSISDLRAASQRLKTGIKIKTDRPDDQAS